MPKYDNLDAARAVAMQLATDADEHHARIVKKRQGLTDKHDLAIALIPDAKPAATTHTAPVDSSQRKVVERIGRSCCGFSHPNFHNR